MTAPVAVVIPNLYSPYLQSALASVFAQTTPPCEVLVVQSWTSTGLTASPITAAFPKIAAVYEPRPGIAIARNRGVRETSAPWLVQLDADDWLEPTYIEKCGKWLWKSEKEIPASDGERKIGIIGPGIRHHGLPFTRTGPGSSQEPAQPGRHGRTVRNS